jgi:ABC-type sugar transport system ATPase subunit
VAPASEDGASEIRGTVHTYESLGEEGQLAAMIGSSTVLVVTPPDLRLNRGDPVTLRLRSDHIHLFDAATQAAI